MNSDFIELEIMANDLKNRRATLNIRRLGHLKTVEQEILEADDNIVTPSGRINYKKMFKREISDD